MLSSRCIVSIKNMPLWYDDYTAYHHLACIIITIQLLMIPYDSIFFRKIKFTYEPRQQTGILDIHISYLCKHLHILCHKLILFIFLNRYYEYGRLWLDCDCGDGILLFLFEYIACSEVDTDTATAAPQEKTTDLLFSLTGIFYSLFQSCKETRVSKRMWTPTDVLDVTIKKRRRQSV